MAISGMDTLELVSRLQRSDLDELSRNNSSLAPRGNGTTARATG